MARRIVLKSEPAGALPPGLRIDYARELNPQQLQAATAGGGPTLIVAGAGTGKTRTLVYRVAYLVETGVPPEAIVLLTFTRRAAREMLGRAAGLLDGRCERVQGGTFHAFAVRLLRRYAEAIGYPPRFTILDQQDAADVLDLLRTAEGLDRSERRFPKKGTLQRILSAAVNCGLEVAEVLEAEYPQHRAHAEAVEALRARFAAYKREHGLMDYDDLLARSVELLETQEKIHRRVAAEARHVLVDEYQDVNGLQARLVQLLAAAHGNVTAVGDDAQSIYRFRGADVRHILDFPAVFPGARLLKLEHNYRSTQPILDLANWVLAGAARKYEKRLFTDRKEGERPALVQAPDAAWQSQFVAQTVLQKREEGVPLNRMAVLFRGGHNSYDVEVELARRGVPFVKFGGLRLAEAAHVKDVVAYLRAAENPRDVVAWARALRTLEGVGPRTAERVIGALLGAPDPLTPRELPVPARTAGPVERLLEAVRALRDAEAGLGEQVEAVVHHYRPHFERLYADDHPQREADLDALAAVAAGHRSRRAFLEALALDPLDLTATDADAAFKDEPPLVLSTVHSAKGLEFDTVFLIEALDGVLPSQYALRSEDELDEERRLLYVALTRAARDLYVSYPAVSRVRAGGYLASPSRFLKGVPERLLEPAVLVQDAAPPALPPPRGTSDGLPF